MSPLEEKFERLAQEAWEANRFHSTMEHFLAHPAYQEILKMGTEAIPFILRRMAAGRGHWFHAMRTLTGQDPVPAHAWGRIPEMNNAWLRWAQQAGYQW